MSSESDEFIEISSDEIESISCSSSSGSASSADMSLSDDISESLSSSYDSEHYHSDDLERMRDERDTEYIKCAFINVRDVPCGEDASVDNTRDYCSFHNKIMCIHDMHIDTCIDCDYYAHWSRLFKDFKCSLDACYARMGSNLVTCDAHAAFVCPHDRIRMSCGYCNPRTNMERWRHILRDYTRAEYDTMGLDVWWRDEQLILDSGKRVSENMIDSAPKRTKRTDP